MKKYNISKDFNLVSLLTFPIIPQAAPIAEKVLGTLVSEKQSTDKVKVIKKQIDVFDGSIDILIFEPNGIKQHSPALLYYHGGGFIYKAAPYHYSLAKTYCQKVGCRVIMPDYRLTPKNKFPIPFDDCKRTLEYVINNADKLSVNADNIVIGGDSAGGCLAAGVTLWARNNGVKIKGQMLVYPVTDITQTSESIKKYTDTPVWNAKLTQKMWKLYSPSGKIKASEYLSPMFETDFSGLPCSYVEVAEFDALHDEGLEYAEKMKNGGVDVEIYETKGTMHGFDMAQKSVIVYQSIGRRTDFLRRAFK